MEGNHLCFREKPTLQPEEKTTFPCFAKKQVVLKNGDVKEEFVELSEEEKKNLRSYSPYCDIGIGDATAPIQRDKFDALDEVEAFAESVNDDDFKDD